MSPQAVNLPPLEIPAPVATPASALARRGGESFQDHLRRAGDGASTSRSADDSRRSADGASTAKQSERRDDRTDEPQQSKRGEEAKLVDRGARTETKPTDAAKTDQADDGAVAEKSKTGAETEQQPGGDDRQPGDGDAEAVAAAAAAVAALKEVAVAPGDEVTLSDEVEESVVAIDDAEHDGGRPAAARDPAGAVKEALAESQLAASEAPVDPTAIATPADTPPTADEAAVAEAPSIDGSPQVSLHDNQNASPTATIVEKPAETTVAADAPPAETKSEAPTSNNEDPQAKAAKSSETVAAAQPVVASASAAAVRFTTTQTLPSASDGENERDEKHAGQKIEAATGARQQRAEQAATAADRAAAAIDPARPTMRRDASVADNGPAGDSGTLSHADRARLVQRVARAVTTAHERGGDLKLRLSPPELGSLRLQVSLSDGVLTARLEAETPQARQIIAESLPQLRERLAEQNIRVERFDVDLLQSGGGGLANTPDRRQDDAHERGPRLGRSTSTASRNAADVAVTDVRVNRRGAGGLDIVA